VSDTTAAVLDYYACIDRGDIDAALRCFAATATYRRPGYPPLVGRTAIRDFYVETRAIASGTHRLDRVVATPDDVAVRGTFTGLSRAGEPLAVRFADFWHFADGQVVERDTYFDAPAV
jgi:steroid delta-isomerase